MPTAHPRPGCELWDLSLPHSLGNNFPGAPAETETSPKGPTRVYPLPPSPPPVSRWNQADSVEMVPAAGVHGHGAGGGGGAPPNLHPPGPTCPFSIVREGRYGISADLIVTSVVRRHARGNVVDGGEPRFLCIL